MSALNPPERRHRVRSYLLANAVFLLAVVFGTALGDSDNPRLLYLVALFGICSSPLLLAKRWNGRYALLCAFMAAYFLFYGLGDFVGLFDKPLPGISRDPLSPGELAILCAGLMTVVGYRTAISMASRSAMTKPPKDWSGSMLIVTGLALWAAGLLATWTWQMDAFRFAFDKTVQLGTFQTVAVIVGRLLQPLGMTLLVYRFVVSRNKLLGALVLAMVAAEFVFGFLADSKELAMRGMVLLLLCKFLLEGRAPKTWLAVAAVVVVVAFPVFQAYRGAVLGERGVTRAEAAQQIGKYLEIAFQRKERRSGNSLYSSRSFVSRISLKPTMETIVTRVGDDVKYQGGYTLSLFVTGFVPRFIWHDKPDGSVGQLFNAEFRLASRGVYISATHFGELYWNFGWPGLLVGSGLLGCLLGYIGKRCDLTEGRSVTRLLVLSSTVYFLCLRYEGSIALEYMQWVRSLLVIGTMHLVLARQRAHSQEPAPEAGQTRTVSEPPPRNGEATLAQTFP